jgi:hypothetical protein
MRKTGLPLILFGLMLGFSTSANAQATRTWVSGVGDDVNPCSRTAPCKTFAGAISKTAAGGEINCLDPGGFGAVTIVKAMTISCEMGTAGVLVAAGNGVNVSAGANDAVYLKGLDFEGLNGTANPGLNGIQFNTGASLTVDNCTIRDFSNFGIKFVPSTIATLNVVNTRISRNGTASAGGGVQVSATGFARALLSRVTIDKNNFVGVSATGLGPTSAIQVFESTISHNSSNGIIATGAGAVVTVGGSAIIGNGSAATSGNVLSYGNNEIKDNNPDTVPGSAGGLH